MTGITVKKFIAGQLENNIYLVIDDRTKKAVLIDASSNVPEIAQTVKESGADVEYILLTHGHFDHIMGSNSLKQTLNAKAVIHKDDLIISDNINEYTQLFGLPDSTAPKYELYIKDGDIIPVGDMKIKVIHTPGHTEGGVCYLIDDKLFSGDTLFKESVGRTDLFGGSFQKLSDSIKNKLFMLDDNITVFPGHGPTTFIGYEKKHNELI